MLGGANVTLGVTGSIAAVRVIRLAYEPHHRGASARAAMTDTATRIIHPWTVEFAINDNVVTEITGRIEHVDLCGRDGWADMFLATPATANAVGKTAAVIDDSPVATTVTTAFGADVPVVVVPAVCEPVYGHPDALDTVEWVRSWDVEFIDSRIKEGKTEIATEEVAVTGVAKTTTDQTPAGTPAAVTTGVTTKSADSIHALSNRASGRAGRVAAHALMARGADVTLVHDDDDAHYTDVLIVESTAEVLDTVEAVVGADADALVSAAVISDFTAEVADQKIRSGGARTLGLEPAPKLINTCLLYISLSPRDYREEWG